VDHCGTILRASAVIGWIRGHWQLLLGILTGPVGAAVAFIIRHWGQVVTGAQGVLNFFRGAWQNLEHLLVKPFQAALGVIRGIWKTIIGWIHGITGFLGGGGTVPGGRGHGMGGGSTGANARLAQRMVPQWSSGANWAAWNYVAMRESGWSQYAENATSGAYGIPQALPPTKLPFAGQKAGGSQPGPQIGWMARYMAGRYGGPIGAAAHERTFNWYHDGGPITEAISGIGLSGRRYGFEAGEWVTSRRDAGRGGGWHDEAALGLLEELIGAVYASAGLTGEAMGAALRGGARRASYQALYGTS